jgi:SH3-like domain-containing protein
VSKVDADLATKFLRAKLLGMKGHIIFARALIVAGLALSGWLHGQMPAAAQAADTNGQTIGPVSGLPMPRYVSLKADKTNLREGPSKDHRTTWVYQRAGLPVEITGEYGMWRKVRDSDGTEGWVLHNLLSGRRTAIVAPWKKGSIFTLYIRAAEDSAPVARLQPGVIGGIKTCDGNWCEIYGDGFDGFIQQNNLWGVYPNEKVE